MGVFSVFRRNKKEEEEIQPLDFGAGQSTMHGAQDIDFSPDLGPVPREDKPLFTQVQPVQAGINDRDMQLILAKLELLNRKLDDMDNRLRFIEKVAKESK